MTRRNKKKRRTAYSLYRKWSEECLTTKGYCPICNNKLLYYCKYDSDICMYCNTWRYDGCNDPECRFCANRPATPEEALQLNNPLSENEMARNFKVRKRLRDPVREKQLDKANELNAKKAPMHLINQS